MGNQFLISSSCDRIESTIALASPRGLLRKGAREAARLSTGNAASGRLLIDTALFNNARAPWPAVRRRGRHLAPALYSVTTTSPTGIGRLPREPPSDSTECRSDSMFPFSRIANARAYGCTSPL